LYYTKGSGSNGVDTVYFVDTTGTACPSGSGLPIPGASLPTASDLTYNTNDPALGLTAKNSTDASDYPFGLWFANPYTLYVADEGAGDNHPPVGPEPRHALHPWPATPPGTIPAPAVPGFRGRRRARR
jgi:hypothetical protein